MNWINPAMDEYKRRKFSKHYIEQFKGENDKDFYARIQFTKKFLIRKPKLVEVFNTFDTDKSTFLNRGEIYRMVKLSKPKFTNDELSALFAKMDTNHDHKVSKDEFVLYYFNLFFNETDSEFAERIEETFSGRRKVKLQMLFNMYDLDGNGILDLNEFALMLKLNGRKFVSADVILDTLIKVDKDKNRKVDFSEWMDYMGGMCAQMDDAHFNKAINNMMAAAQKNKEDEKANQASLAARVTTSASAAASPAVGSKPVADPQFAQKGVHGHGHGHTHAGPAAAPAATVTKNKE